MGCVPFSNSETGITAALFADRESATSRSWTPFRYCATARWKFTSSSSPLLSESCADSSRRTFEGNDAPRPASIFSVKMSRIQSILADIVIAELFRL